VLDKEVALANWKMLKVQAARYRGYDGFEKQGLLDLLDWLGFYIGDSLTRLELTGTLR